MQTLKLGSTVKDKVSGFTGVVTSRCEYITGCVQYGVTPKVDKEGKLLVSNWFDEDRLTVLKRPLVMGRRPTGGPQSTPRRETPPTR
jgi:hypothetical protein